MGTASEEARKAIPCHSAEPAEKTPDKSLQDKRIRMEGRIDHLQQEQGVTTSEERQAIQTCRTRISTLPRRRKASTNALGFQTATPAPLQLEREECQVKEEANSPGGVQVSRKHQGNQYGNVASRKQQRWTKNLMTLPYGHQLVTSRRPSERRIRWSDRLRLGLKLIKQEFASGRSGHEVAQLFSDTFATELTAMGVTLPVTHGRLNWQYSEYLKGTGVQTSWDRVAAAGLMTVVAIRRRIRAASLQRIGSSRIE